MQPSPGDLVFIDVDVNLNPRLALVIGTVWVHGGHISVLVRGQVKYANPRYFQMVKGIDHAITR